jgi:hypothetical protein
MKTFATLAALSVALLAGCSSTQNTAAPGAVGANKSECCSAKSECTATKQAAPGAVGAEKSGCCSAKTECSAAAKSAPGAVSAEKKSGCCASKAACPASQN